MRTVVKRAATLLAGLTITVPATVTVLGGTASAGTYCAVRNDGAPVYAEPRSDARIVNTLRRGPEVGCGSSSSPDFAIVTRLDNHIRLGYARWSDLETLGGG